MTTASVAPPAQPSAFAVFRRPTFRLLWSGQFVSTIGDALLIAGAGILIFQRTNSALSVGLMAAATVAPALVVGLLAGVIVDRYDRRRIMLASDLLRAVIVALIPILVRADLVFLYVLVAASAAVSEFFNPALDATLPEIAPDEELGAANSLMAISSFGSTAVGFAAGGLIAALGDVQLAFVLDALSFAFSALCTYLSTIPRIPVSGDTSLRAVGSNLRDGLRVLVETPILRSMLPIGIVYAVACIGIWNALLLPFSIRALHASTFDYGLQEGLTSVGFVAGSLVMAQLVGRLREGQWMVLGYLAMGLMGVAYGLSNSIELAIAAVAVSGFANAFTSTAGRLVRQRYSPREYRGRVMSVFSVVSSVFGIVGMVLAGLADVIDIRLLVVVASLATILVGLFAAVLPGLGQAPSEWRRITGLLRAAVPAPGALGGLRPVTLADFETLVGLVPTLHNLERHGREDILIHGRIGEAPAGVCILAQGDPGDAAYFVLSGTAVAGTPTGEGYRSLSEMGPGDFFGEIAALTGTKRTANVVAAEPLTLLEIPAGTLHRLMQESALGELVVGKMSERLARTSRSGLPKFGGLDPAELRELRTPAPA